MPVVNTSTVLTDDQREVVISIALGATTKETAKIRGCSPKTVEYHRTEAYKRIGVDNPVDLTHWAIGVGLVKVKYTRKRNTVAPLPKPVKPVVNEQTVAKKLVSTTGRTSFASLLRWAEKEDAKDAAKVETPVVEQPQVIDRVPLKIEIPKPKRERRNRVITLHQPNLPPYHEPLPQPQPEPERKPEPVVVPEVQPSFVPPPPPSDPQPEVPTPMMKRKMVECRKRPIQSVTSSEPAFVPAWQREEDVSDYKEEKTSIPISVGKWVERLPSIPLPVKPLPSDVKKVTATIKLTPLAERLIAQAGKK